VALRCLLVDDNEQFLASATRLLESQGLDVVGRARSGAEALRLTRELAPDVVLVDVQLGDEDGLELARQLALGPRSPRIVLISTRSERVIRDLIVESPAVGFLAKTELSADAIAAVLD
jgi:two-component system, NarL family, nitrate/nitrite response regulator NarL